MMPALSLRRRFLRALPFILAWSVGLALYAEHNWVLGPTDAPMEIPRSQALLAGLPWASAEVVVLYFILRPDSFRWSWGRVLLALGIAAPLASLVPLWHLGWVHGWWSGGNFAHGYWWIGVAGVLAVVFAVSLAGALVTSARAGPKPG